MAAARDILLGVVVFTLAGCGAAQRSPEPDRLAEVDWPKHLTACPIGDTRGFGRKVDDIVKAEVTGDRFPDTLIIDSCDSPTASNPQLVEIFDGDSEPGAPRRLGTLMADDPDYPRRMKVSVDAERKITVRALGLQPESPRCCPDLEIVAEFAWRDGSFVTLSRQTRPV